jgi:anti-sigma factor RsiW
MTMPDPHDGELQAWVDGRVDADQAAQVAAWLSAHPDEAARVAALRLHRAAIAEAYAGVVDEPVPARLLEAAAGPGSAALSRSRAQGGRRAPMRWLAIAATLVIGVAAGWSLRGVHRPAEIADLVSLPRDAAIAHAVYSPEVRHPVEVAATEEAHLVAWLSKRLGHKLGVPRLADAGYELVGGRLLPAGEGPAAQFMYQDGAGRRLTLYVRTEPDKMPATAFRFVEEGPVRVFYWVDGSLGYALSGELARDELLSLATVVHRQLGGS